MYLINEGHQKRVGNEAGHVLRRCDFYSMRGSDERSCSAAVVTWSYLFHKQLRMPVRGKVFLESFEVLRLARLISTDMSTFQATKYCDWMYHDWNGVKEMKPWYSQ